jgi:single-stranded-DNA-specific exonuclease
LEVDAELDSAAITRELADELKRLEPFGVGWPCPVFATRDFRIARDPQVLKGRHLKFQLAGADGRQHTALWWNSVETLAATPPAGRRIELAYRIETDTWRDETRLQLIVEDMRISGQ